jgi:site-specific DNA-methyltransferase (adenine-specific)
MTDKFTLEESKMVDKKDAPLCSGSLDLRLGDCMDVMREFPDGYFDLAVVDPPYGIGAAAKGIGRHTREKITRGDMQSKQWDSAIPSDAYFQELRRVSREQIIWGGNYFPFLWDKGCRGFILWDKGNGMRGRDFCEGELAWNSINTVARIFYYDLLADGKERQNKIHPTQKPVALYQYTLANYAPPGQRILDTHLGSGSSAIAAHYAGMHLTACEIDPDYYEAAKARIARETSQLAMNL